MTKPRLPEDCPWCDYCDEQKKRIRFLASTNNDLKKEIEEQARLLGKSGSREAALNAKIQHLEKELNQQYVGFSGIVRERDKVIERQDAEIWKLKKEIYELFEVLKIIRQQIGSKHSHNCLMDGSNTCICGWSKELEKLDSVLSKHAEEPKK